MELFSIFTVAIRGLFAFGFMMRWGQALLDLHKTVKNTLARFALSGVSKVWFFAMGVSGLFDIFYNITLVTILTIPLSILNWMFYRNRTDKFIDLPRRLEGRKIYTCLGETFSYRLGRWCFSPEFAGTIFRPIGMKFRAILEWAEGHPHVDYIYGLIPCPYPDIKELLNWKMA